MEFRFYMPTEILFGKGCFEKFGEYKLPGEKALVVVSDDGFTQKKGHLPALEKQLKNRGISVCVFDKIKANPTETMVEEGVKYARKSGCDFIIALGGGSVMDVSKVIAAMVNNKGSVWDYMVGGSGKEKPLDKPILPIISITTTAGTGSEVNQWGVITNENLNEKMGFGGYDSLFPKTVIVDPTLTHSVPPELTAYQGFDVLLQAAECYISNRSNLMSDMYALTAIENVSKYLATAVKDGKNAEAREHMAFANIISGLAMTLSDPIAEHSLEHAMSAYHPNLPHGAGLIMICNEFFDFFIRRRICSNKFINMARAMGIKNSKNPDDFLTALTTLKENCGVNNLKMSDYGFKPDEFEILSQNAIKTMGSLFLANPSEMTEKDCTEILKKSYR